jgi:D-sedoheptulose 7-phosphate isomerase
VSDFLYPFLEGSETDTAGLLADLAASARAKGEQSAALLAVTLERLDATLDEVAAALADRVAAGGRVFAFGNGGSATDAAGLAALFRRPPHGRPLPARALAAEPAVLTALGNDVGFDLVFVRQLIAHGRAGDAAVGLSTSGNSANLLAAFAEARRRGMLTVGLAGYDGGQMAASADVEHCLVVRADSIHRIQEVQSYLVFELWRRLQERLPALAGSPL